MLLLALSADAIVSVAKLLQPIFGELCAPPKDLKSPVEFISRGHRCDKVEVVG